MRGGDHGRGVALLLAVAACVPVEEGGDEVLPDRRVDDVPLTTTPSDEPPLRFDTGDPLDGEEPVWSTELFVGADDHGLTKDLELDLGDRWCTDARSFGVTAVDLDADGHVDLAAPVCHEVRVWRGRGDGTFEDPQTLRIGLHELDLAMGVWFHDLDADGLPELFYPGTEGLRVLHNGGGLQFTDVVGNHGIPQRWGQPASLSFFDADGDGDLDLFAAFSFYSFNQVARASDQTAFEGTQNELYLRQEDGSFAAVRVPEGHGRYSLHTLPLDDGCWLTLSDFATAASESAQYCLRDGVVSLRAASQVLGTFLRAPMGGARDFMVGRRDQLWLSEDSLVRAFDGSGRGWVAVGRTYGLRDYGFSWSVVSMDVDLDSYADAVVSFGRAPIFGEFPQRTYPGAAPETRGLRVYHGAARAPLDTVAVVDGPSFLGLAAADLDGDGLREVVAREVDSEGGGGSLQVWRAASTRPRVELQLADACAGAVVDYGAVKRRFLPYTNTGSFGHGTAALTLAWQQDVPVEIVLGERVWRYNPPPANTRMRATCGD